jgi:hypothetical protein
MSVGSNMHDRGPLTGSLLRGLQEWCAREAGATDARPIDPDKPFHCHNPEWGKRFKLRDALLPWVTGNTPLATFYPDELAANSTPRSVARHLSRRLRCVRESAVRPPVIPRRTGRVEEPTVFVLGCPRSGTTIFRCMLMGHPEIYAGPELHLIPFQSLRQRERKIVDLGAPWMVMGLAQTIRDLTGWTEREAFHYMSILTRRDLPVADVYRIIHGYCPKPVVVDKSPVLTNMPFQLDAIESKFRNPRYLHITRHPRAVIASILKVEAPPFAHLKNEAAAEEFWCRTNSSVCSFLNRIPRRRWHRLSYEELMGATEGTLRGVTDFLGMSYDSSMADPYGGNRLQQGIGCVNLPKRKALEPGLATAWLTNAPKRALQPETAILARRFGYQCG